MSMFGILVENATSEIMFTGFSTGSYQGCQYQYGLFTFEGIQTFLIEIGAHYMGPFGADIQYVVTAFFSKEVAWAVYYDKVAPPIGGVIVCGFGTSRFEDYEERLGRYHNPEVVERIEQEFDSIRLYSPDDFT